MIAVACLGILTTLAVWISLYRYLVILLAT